MAKIPNPLICVVLLFLWMSIVPFNLFEKKKNNSDINKCILRDVLYVYIKQASLHLKYQCITCTHNIVTHINYCIHVLSPGPVLKVCLASKAAPNKGVAWLQSLSQNCKYINITISYYGFLRNGNFTHVNTNIDAVNDMIRIPLYDIYLYIFMSIELLSNR